MDMKHKAKRKMLEKLKKVMSGMGAEDILGGMGVEVHAKDKKGLIEGLDKAKEVVKESDEIEELPEEEEDDIDYENYSKEELIEMMKNR